MWPRENTGSNGNPKVEIKDEQEGNVINMRERKRAKWKTWKDNQAVMTTGVL